VETGSAITSPNVIGSRLGMTRPIDILVSAVIPKSVIRLTVAAVETQRRTDARQTRIRMIRRDLTEIQKQQLPRMRKVVLPVVRVRKTTMRGVMTKMCACR